MGDRQTYITNQIVKYSHKLEQKNFGANHDGNISAKFEDMLLATPTAVSKGNVVAEMIITLNMQGEKIAGIGKPFSEIKLHLAAYETRAEAKAVVHAHPPFATALGLIAKPLYPLLPEAIVSIGDCIPVIAFALPGTEESINNVKTALTIADVFMLPGNGVLAIGEDVEQAYLRIELVEHVAKIQYYANTMGEPMQLAPENLTKLLEKRAAIGLGPKLQKNNATACHNQNFNQDSHLSVIKQLITEEIKKVL